jgi:Ca2+-binding RTX toxin-like protein
MQCTAINSKAVACKHPSQGLWITLGDGSDTATSSADILTRYFGGPGDDVIDAGPGMDIIDGGPGADAMMGGSGTDEVTYENATSGVFADLDGMPNDDGAPGEGDSIALTVENLRGGPFADTLVGDPFDNQISGGPGNDVIEGAAGNDVIDGAAGNDLLVPGAGDDIVNGGPGTDRVDYQDHTAGVIADLDGASGDDGSPGERDTLGADLENLTGTALDDVLIGNDSANEITGLAGQNIIKGLGGADKLTAGSVIFGGDGNDTITGAATGQGYLVGEAGNDTIVGKSPFDLIDGGPNTDACTGEKLFNCE